MRLATHRETRRKFAAKVCCFVVGGWVTCMSGQAKAAHTAPALHLPLPTLQHYADHSQLQQADMLVSSLPARPATPAADHSPATTRQLHQQVQLLAKRHPQRGAAWIVASLLPACCRIASSCHHLPPLPQGCVHLDGDLAQVSPPGMQPWIAVAGHSTLPHALREWQVDVIQRLEHPCIVKLHEWFVHGGKLYLIMDLLAGQCVMPAGCTHRGTMHGCGPLIACCLSWCLLLPCEPAAPQVTSQHSPQPLLPSLDARMCSPCAPAGFLLCRR